MKKIFLTGMLFLSFLTQAMAGHDGGNAGAGVNRDGRYMTFYSAGFFTERAEQGIEEVPELNNLIEFFEDFEILGDLSRIGILKNLLPSNTRKYYKVDSDTFTKELKDKLIAEYKRVTGASASELTIFAITNIHTSTTYLLPEFYELKPQDQWAVLFHEAYWLYKSTALRVPTYDQVVEAEVKFQAYLNNQDSTEALLAFLEVFSSSADVIRTIINYDIENKTAEPFIQNGSIKFSEIVGQKWLNCAKRNAYANCNDYMVLNLYKLTRAYPDSLFIRYLYGHGRETNGITFRSVRDVANQTFLFNQSCLSGYAEKDSSASLQLDSLDLSRPEFLIHDANPSMGCPSNFIKLIIE